MFDNRKILMKEMEGNFGFKPILYVTGDRPSPPNLQLQSQIQEDVLPVFLDHLDTLGKVKHIGLIIYSRGGNITAGWSIINLIRQFCEKLSIIVPFRAQSTATLMCLGADEVVMTKQAILGPIDPSTNGCFNPIPPGNTQSGPLSVEDLAAFLNTAKDFHLGPSEMSNIVIKLCDFVNPIAIGKAYRSRAQIRNLAEKLMNLHSAIKKENRAKLISTLCEDAGSHDYTIHRREATMLGFKIRKPNDEQYKLIKDIYEDFEKELELNVRYNFPDLSNAGRVNSSLKLGLLESPDYKSNQYCHDVILTKVGPDTLNINVPFSGWR